RDHPRAHVGDVVVEVEIARGSLAVAHLFFFFQAEDGIRDLIVTGVQTCALPICSESAPLNGPRSQEPWASTTMRARMSSVCRPRSEERRVGKECRSRWWRYHQKNKYGGEREQVR